MSLASYPLTSPTSFSDDSSSQQPALDPAAATTRSLRAAEALQLSAPASQESLMSGHSGHSGHGWVSPRAQMSSGTASQTTSYTDLTSHSFAPPKRSHDQRLATRVHTPDAASLELSTTANHGETSPMSITSPAPANGTKRTASGHIKHDPALPSTPLASAFPERRPRADSTSSTSSRAGDLAMSLKTRLGYAMAKVQHGWEHKNIREVEHLARHKANRHSMSHLDYSRPTMGNGHTNGTRLPIYDSNGQPVYPPSKRHSASFSSLAPAPTSVSASQPLTSTGPRLQPAADIRPASSSQPHYSTTPSANYTTIMSPPRTPLNGPVRRPPTIRTELQTAEAEREALQALFELGSPRGSQNARWQNTSQVSSSQASPLRSEFATPRKVTFARSESESDSSARRLSSDGSAGDNDTREMVQV